MAFNVNQFRTQLTGDGARPNLFEVRLTFPGYASSGASASAKSSFMVKTAALPGSTLGMVTVPYFGREVKVAGNRTFADWSVTIINDEDFLIRNAMNHGFAESTIMSQTYVQIAQKLHNLMVLTLKCFNTAKMEDN